MRKKSLAIILGTTMMMSLVACGGKDKPDNKPISTDVSVESTMDAGSDASSESINEQNDLGDASELTDGVYDYDKEYTADMLAGAIPQDNVCLNANSEGVMIGMATVGDDMLVTMGYEDAETGNNVGMELYVIGADMYSHTYDTASGMDVYKHTLLEGDANSEDLTGSFMNTSDFDIADSSTIEYVETVVENGVARDVVRVVSVDEEAVVDSENVTVTIDGEVQDPQEMYSTEMMYYINVDTGMVDRVTTNEDGNEIIVTFEPITCIELAPEFTTADVLEISNDDMAMELFGMLMMTASGAGDITTEDTTNNVTENVVEDTTEEISE